MICQLHNINWDTFLFNYNMIKYANTYVRNNVSQIKKININWCSKNSQQYMLDNPDLKNISIDDYKQEILLTFMLALCAFFTCSLALVNV